MNGVLEPATAAVRVACLHVEQTAASDDGHEYRWAEGKVRKEGDLLVDLGAKETTVTLQWKGSEEQKASVRATGFKAKTKGRLQGSDLPCC